MINFGIVDPLEPLFGYVKGDPMSGGSYVSIDVHEEYDIKSKCKIKHLPARPYIHEKLWRTTQTIIFLKA